jgi:hypothetical protein
MRWRDKRDACFAASLDSGRHNHPLLVHRNWDNFATGHLQDLSRQNVPGFFHPHSVPWIEQCSCRYLKSLLRTAHDQDLFGFTVHGSRGSQISRDRFPEFQ